MNTGGKFTAHPKMDPETGEMVWFGYFAGPQRFSHLIDYGVTDKTGKVTRRDRFAAPYASVIHDFIVTRNYVMFPVLPLTGDLQRGRRACRRGLGADQRRLHRRDETQRSGRFDPLV